MTDTQQRHTTHKAMARRNIKTAVGLGVLALCLYVGYFLFQYMT